MRRRDLLALTTGAACGLAGCADSRFERLQSERPDVDGSSDDTDRRGSESAGPDAIVVGDPDEVPFLEVHPPHEFTLRNDGETERTVAVVVSADDADGSDSTDGDGEDERDEPLLERNLDLGAGEERTLVFVEPRSYTITVTSSRDGGTGESTVTDGISRRPFDCVRSRTTVTLSESGTETESTSSSIPCPVPDVADASLAVDGRECAGRTDGDDATVEFENERVLVEGSIRIPTPCHTLELSDVTYDDGRDLLVVTVAVGEQEAETCVDCLGTADYEAGIDLEGRYPGRVAVVHATVDERRVITTNEFAAG
ncbi:hypothetical protein ACERIM_11870 [Natrinema sp. H-ect1]|uniref:hypothetical protein n=1 Tax=Natrinema sp. H-ect1 TaxID=3242700 RepID=UPI00359E366E